MRRARCPHLFGSFLRSRHWMSAALAGIMAGMLALYGCGEEDSTDVGNVPPPVASVVVSPETETLFALGETTQLTAIATDAEGDEIPEATFVWSSSDVSVASVSSTGEVSSVGSGSAVITATSGEVSGAATIWVDPELVLQDYCAECHAPFHDASVSTASCRDCHSMSLTPVSDDHGSIVNGHVVASGGFELLGAHEQLRCWACHDPVSGTPQFDPADQTDCITCHENDYQGQHAGSGYPTICLDCHTTLSWGGASFDHGTASGGFDLIGAHTQLACTSCHDPVSGDPLYDPANENDCIVCHADDYQGQHAGSGFPTTCRTCHTVNSWSAATFDHDSQFFPIFSGDHKSEWSSCETCHVNASDFGVFTCFNCHKHDKDKMDREHEDVGGYVYESSRCLACHPDGKD